MKWFINYHTGAGDVTFDGTEEQAKAKADEGISYTQQDVTIESDEGRYIRRWYGSTASDEDEINDIIKFGDSGFYDEWLAD